jgi:hypothetical protein
MVSEAQRSRAPIQRLADVVSSYFVPAVLAIAVVTFAVWAAFGPSHDWRMRWSTPSRSHHRLPVRARVGDADVDHGGHRPRRAGGRA